MKNFNIILIILFASVSIAGAWTQNLMINDADTPGNHRSPDVFIDEDGIIHTVWVDFRDDSHVYYSRSEDGGESFGSNIKVSSQAGVRGERQQGPVVYARDGHIYVTWNNTEGDVNIYISHSDDDGQSWSERLQVNQDEPENQFFQDMAVDSEGRVFVTWMEFPHGLREPGYIVARSENNAESFDNYIMVNEGAPGEVCDCCSPDITIDEQDRIFVSWRNNDDNIRDTYMARSDNNGDSFEEPVNVYANNWRLNACPSTGPSIRVAGDKVYVAWINGSENVWRVWFGVSDDGGESFNDARVLRHDEDADVRQNFPEIALGNDGDVWVTWQDNRNGRNDIFTSLSRDYGESFSFSYMVNNDGEDVIQESPMGATGPDGEYAIVWLDRRRNIDDIFFSAERLRIPKWTRMPYDSYEIASGETIEFDFGADGALADTLTFSLARFNISENAVLVDNGDRSGSFSWTTTQDDIGVFDIAIILSNGDISDSAWFSIEVLEPDGIIGDPVNPWSYNLLSTYPNPFNSVVKIEYILPYSTNVELSVYNLNGEFVSLLVSGYESAGAYSAEWSGKDLSAGIYFIHLTSNGAESINKVLLVR